MSESQAVVALGAVVSILIGILGYFLHRLISGIDDGLKDLKEEVYKDRTIITKHIDRLQTEIMVLKSHIETSGVTINYIQKKIEAFEKTQEVVITMSNRLVATETKLDNLGKIIYVGQKKQ